MHKRSWLNIIWLVILLASFLPLTIQQVVAQSPIIKTKQIASLSFEGQNTTYTNLYHSFDPSGIVTVTNDQKDVIKLYLLDIGTVTSVELVQVSKDIIGHKQSWSDKNGSYTVWTYFDFAKLNNGVKITYTGNLPKAGTITQKIELPTTNINNKALFQRYDDKSKTISNTEIDIDGNTLSGIGFSWGDAPDAIYSIKDNIINLSWNANISFTIDPSTVATSTSSWGGSATSAQRHAFYGSNLHWVFYTDGTDGVYRTSIDGNSWSAANTVRVGITLGYWFSIFYDGTYIHYVWSQYGVANQPLYYRRGIPTTTGTITWSAAEQTAIAAVVGTEYNAPSVAPDSAGYIYIGYCQIAGGFSYPYCTRSQFNDGTWGATPAGFPYQLNAVSLGNWRVNTIPLTATKMGFAYMTSTTPRVRSYTGNGAVWNAEVASTLTCASPGAAVGMIGSDNIHMMFQEAITNNLTYLFYQYSTNTIINVSTAYIAGLPGSAVGITYNNDDNMIYAIWFNTPTAQRIYYKKYNPTTLVWDTNPTLLVDESTNSLASGSPLANYHILNDVLGICYTTGTASPYNVRYLWRTTANMTIDNAKVFTNYIETGDWLITLLYQNFTQPYYTQGKDVSEYFYIQLTNTTGNVTLAQTKCPAWGYMPGYIYLNAGQVSGLEWGLPYIVQLYGNFSGYPIAQYTLTPVDWMGTDLNRLDTWIREATVVMENFYGVTLTTFIAGKGLVLNETGGSIFDTNIPTLSSIRPNLFQIVTTTPGYTPVAFTDGTAAPWQTLLGPQLTAMYTNLGSSFNISGGTVGAVSGFAFYAVVAALAFPAGSAIAAISIPFVILLVIWYTGLLPMAALGFICAIAAFFLIYQFWWLKAG